MDKAFHEKTIEGVVNRIHISEPEIHVDHESRGRSGHMGHAMVEFKKGHILDFNANASGQRWAGHSPFGWMEYRISNDYGKTFGEAKELPYAKQAFLDGVYTISVEKAVACEDGTIVALCLRNSAFTESCCMPWDTPVWVCSKDGGESWTEPKELCSYKGRIYAARYHEGNIYVLEFCNEGENDFHGTKPEHVYRLYKSENHGESFEEVCVVPFPATQYRTYGALLFNAQGELMVYAYNVLDETHMDYIISRDGGKTWGEAGLCHVAQKIRNPQIALLDGQYILHGRCGVGPGFVMYTSKDGINWDGGHVLDTEKKNCYYSDNILISEPGKPDRLLVQFSETYKDSCVNIMHMWLETAWL